MARVVEEVRKRALHLRRCLQCTAVVASFEHATSPEPLVVQCAGHAHAQRLHPARECGFVICLADQVEMVRLRRIVDDAETVTIGARNESIEQSIVRRSRTQGRQARHEPQGHEHWMALLQRGAGSVADTIAIARALRTCIAPYAAVLTGEFELALGMNSPHVSSTFGSRRGFNDSEDCSRLASLWSAQNFSARSSQVVGRPWTMNCPAIPLTASKQQRGEKVVPRNGLGRAETNSRSR
jgi:hypothetical protein